MTDCARVALGGQEGLGGQILEQPELELQRVLVFLRALAQVFHTHIVAEGHGRFGQFPRLAEHHAVVGVEQFVEHLHVAEAVHEHVVDVHGEHIAIIGEFRDLAEEQGPFAQIETVVVEFEAALQDVGPFLRRRQMRHVDMSGVHFGHRFEDLETGLLAFLVDDRAHDGMAADHIVQRLVKHVGPDRKHPTPTQMNRNTSSLLADMGSRMTNAPSMKTVVGKMYCMMPSEIIGTLRMPRLRPNWGMAETNPQPMSSRSMYAPPARKCPSPLSPSQIR